MLKRFEVKNYKNFKEKVTIDFANVGGYQFSGDCITNQMLGKMLIYGKNATGKTNLGLAIMDIARRNSISRVYEGIYLNADSKDRYAYFTYVFQFGQDEMIYQYKKLSAVKLYDEELLINGKRIFYYNFEEKESDFSNLKEVGADTVITERYLDSMNRNDEEEDEEEENLPFFRWLISNTALVSDSLLLKMDDYIKRMSMQTVGAGYMYAPRRLYDYFFESLENDNALKDFEAFLNVMGIECELVLEKLPDGKKELYFKHGQLVPFYENASSGTRALVNLYRRISVGRTASFLYIDEFDAFYHYEMAENVMRFFKKQYPDCQVILTTHNTNLMTNHLSRPDCLFILSRAGKLTALCNATERELREGHNLEKMYISGEFERYE